ncbi:MAG: alpha/beta hydrolase [Lachnospiraceae bacterium]|nr:alpha/beta hydrolase [Lachnospiraceae bacterium]
MNITGKTTMKELYEYDPLKKAARYLVGCADRNFWKTIAEDCFEQMHENTPAWGVRDMVSGIQRLTVLAEQGIPYLYDIYSGEEIQADPQKEDVKLFYFPASTEKKVTNKYVLLCSGGAYQTVCNPQEAFPVANRLNELGITAFALNYRTSSPQTKQIGAAPFALEDVAAALRYIDAHCAAFGVSKGRYAMGGFSAGGHLTALWGTKEMGYAAHKCEKPEAFFLDYAFVKFENLDEVDPLNYGAYQIFAGEILNEESIRRVSVLDKIDYEYPPVYLAQCRDDDTVPFSNFEAMKETLERFQIPVKTRCAEIGQHGYGLGTETEMEGWLDEAVDFWLGEQS